MPLIPFDARPHPRLVFGAGSLERLGELARELGFQRTLLVTDAGLVAAGHAQRARALLEEAGIAVTVHDGVRENPTTRDVDACLRVAREAEIDSLVGLGGGSSMDTAKGCNFLLTNGGEMRDYWGVGTAARPMLPLICVPTTAGTGSECQSFALIADERTHQKMACGDPKALAKVALLDPLLTVSQPRQVAAAAGIDAVAHAVESAVTRKRTPLSALYSREAFRLTLRHLERVLRDPEDLEARAAMHLGASYAGLAIENSMLGAAHSAANPLTAHFDVHHGAAVGLMLPHVIRFNAGDPETRGLYHELALAAGLEGNDSSASAERLAGRIEELLEVAGIPTAAAAHGVTEGDLAALAREAAAQWTARFNPREAGVSDFENLYRRALGGSGAPTGAGSRPPEA